MERMMTGLLLAVGCAAVITIAYWQNSREATPAVRAAVLQLKPAVNPVASNAVAAAAQSKDEPKDRTDRTK